MAPLNIFLLCGLATILFIISMVVLFPQEATKFLVRLILFSVYRVHVYQRENIPEYGGAILAPNHISWLDGLLIFATSSRRIRVLIDASFVTNLWTGGLAKIVGLIPIAASPKVARRAIETAREALRAGELVCVFPEGGISRSGQMRAFKPGLLEICKEVKAPIIPVYLDELWGSIFSFQGGRFFWKWPRMSALRVSIGFGRPLVDPKDIHEVRQAVQDLAADVATGRKQRTAAVPRTMIRNCRKSLFHKKIADSSGISLTGGELLVRTIVLRQALLRHVLDADETYVGLLLPPSVASVVANAAVAMAGRVSVNLNYSVTTEVINSCIQRTGIRHAITSRRMMEKLNLKLDTQLIFIEDLLSKVTRRDIFRATLCVYGVPAIFLDHLLGLHRIHGDDVLTVVFTSGSTGLPKGVLLTHHNIATNVEAIEQVIHPRLDDVILGIVPFFHSLGFTATMWGPLLLDIRAAYHPSPLEVRQISKLARTEGATILLATPTFLRHYLRRCEPEDLKSINTIVAGAERLSSSLSDEFESKFGVRPVEGYGTSELSPLVSVNVPPCRSTTSDVCYREGSVGQPIPGVSARVADPDTYEWSPSGKPGMLLVKGPNVMKGYLGQPKETAKSFHDGWYVTGDVARIDSDGFIFIMGRLSRFAKICGEMVSCARIEEAIRTIVGGDPESESDVVVTFVPDDRRGERIVVVYSRLSANVDKICARLSTFGLPKLWIPSANDFLEVAAIPVLGSDKTDLKAVNDLVKRHFRASSPPEPHV